MIGDRFNIRHHYFGYQPAAGHAEGCPRRATDEWEVTVSRQERHVSDQYGDGGPVEEVTVRLLCRKCGVVVFIEGGSGYEGTSVDQTGYGAKPERCGDVWLHPGPPILYHDDRGPWSYYVTASSTPPAAVAEVLGIIAQHVTRRGAIRWTAGYGQLPVGGVHVASEDLYTSKRAAVRWITARFAEEAPL